MERTTKGNQRVYTHPMKSPSIPFFTVPISSKRPGTFPGPGNCCHVQPQARKGWVKMDGLIPRRLKNRGWMQISSDFRVLKWMKYPFFGGYPILTHSHVIATYLYKWINPGNRIPDCGDSIWDPMEKSNLWRESTQFPLIGSFNPFESIYPSLDKWNHMAMGQNWRPRALYIYID